MGQKSLQDLFGIKSKMLLDVGDKKLTPGDGLQIFNPRYRWRQDLVRDMAVFWTRGPRSMLLFGPKGSGKTTLPEQWHFALNTPLWTVTGHKHMTVEDLYGQYLPNKEGGLDWHDGPALRAARAGGSLLINEVNAIHPGVTIALNDLAQRGSVITVPQTGEVVMPHDTFRLFMTANPPGSIYAGRHELDSSTLDRPYKLWVPFMDAADEIEHLVEILEESGVSGAKDLATRMVAVATSVRLTSMDVSKKADAIPETMSTRVLEAWATYWVALQNRPAAVHRALERALTFGSAPVAKEAIHRYVTAEFNVPFEIAPAPAPVAATTP